MAIDPSADVDYALSSAHRSVWTSGDYALIAEEVMAPIGPVLVGASGLSAHDRVLDVAAGSGNISIPAAMTGATVVSSDLTPKLLQRSRLRAHKLGVTLQWREADAQALPFADSEFDVVLSGIGVMFAANHQCAADELVRVCRPGGTISLASWTPEGFFGQMLALIRPYRPTQQPNVPPAALWGRGDYIGGLLGDRVTEIRTERRTLWVSRFGTAEAVRDYFKNHSGPVVEAYCAIGDNPVLVNVLDAQIVELVRQHLKNGTMGWEYLLVTARKSMRA